MCGAISGFHALVSSGTTPKMIDKESDIRTIGYGSMLIEGLVGVVALIAAASLPVDLYYDINVSLDSRRRRLPGQARQAVQGVGIDRNAARARSACRTSHDLKVAGRQSGGRWSSWSAANRCAAAPAGR